jgi:hypothetical protein
MESDSIDFFNSIDFFILVLAGSLFMLWKRNQMFKSMILIIFAMLYLPAYAEVFARVDGTGKVTYTNLAPAGTIDKDPKTDVYRPANKMSPANKITRSEASRDSRALLAENKIPGNVQAKRDDKRRAILIAELKQELEDLLVALDKKDGVAIENHNSNIKLLKKDLGLAK